jgi:exodeoxyribonuclease VIII
MFWSSTPSKLTRKTQNMFYKDWLIDPSGPTIHVPDMKNEDYHGSFSHISASWLKKAPESLYAFSMYPTEEKDEPTPAMIFGTAMHTKLLEPHRFEQEYFSYKKSDLPFPESTMGKKENKEWVASKGYGKIALSPEKMDVLIAMSERVRKDRMVAKAVSSNIEHSIFWHDPDTGIPLKTRPDTFWLNAARSKAIVLDVKTDADGDLYSFSKTVSDSRHDIQAAMQVDGIMKSTGVSEFEYFYLVLSKKYPYDYAIYRLPQEDVEFGRDSYKKHLRQILECTRTGHWPGMNESYAINQFIDDPNDLNILDIKLPAYHYSK